MIANAKGMIDADIPVFPSATMAWRESISSVRRRGTWIDSVRDESSVGCAFGRSKRNYRERIGSGFVIANPRDRIVWSDARPLNMPFLLANFIWTLSGSNRLEMIASYNRRGVCFSDDGVTLASPFGARIFGTTPMQFEVVASLLQRDPTTRRAVINLFDELALVNHSRDVSCALAMQFLVRDGKLDCLVFMRSQSVVMVMPYDIFLFTMLHEAMASRVGMPLGVYRHICASLHYYDDEQTVVSKVLGEDLDITPEPMQPMPPFSENTRNQILRAEVELRRGVATDQQVGASEFYSRLRSLELDDYWRTLFEGFFGQGLEQVRATRAGHRRHGHR